MKNWQIATTITIAVVLTALVIASALVLLNSSKPTNIYTNYPGGYYTYPTANPQTTLPTPVPTAPTYPQTTVPQPGAAAQPIFPAQSAPPTNPVNPQIGTSLTINNAVAIGQNYLTRLNNLDLAVKKVEEYTQNFYVKVYERSTGLGAFELIIDKYNGNIYTESGASSVWNTKYGSSYGYGPGGMEGEGGMMGGWGWSPGTPTTAMAVTLNQVVANAQQYLNGYYPGTTAGYITTFYGYYSVQVLLSGKTYGVLSINGYTGQVWYHTWHGTFIQEVDLS